MTRATGNGLIDGRFERVARHLTTLELIADAADVDDQAERFVDFYSTDGLRRAIHEYGLEAKLAALGIGDYKIELSREDHFRHRMELVLAGGERVMDLHLHLCTVTSPPRSEHVDVVVVDWLLMQNPRASFTRQKPRLPGQTFPGTGLGRDVVQMLLLLCRRISRDGLVVVPERFHLAELYGRGGWAALDAQSDDEVAAVVAGTHALDLTVRAWAVERGCVVDDDGEPYRYAPAERALAATERLQRVLDASRRATSGEGAQRRFRLDVERFRASLRDAPVDGIVAP